MSSGDCSRKSWRSRGYLCHAAPSGEAALAVLSNEPVDLALVDIMMPGMTGLTLFQHMKERYPDVAVVFSTAVNDVTIVVDHLKYGAYDFMVKPVSWKRLLQVVSEALDRRHALLQDKQNRKFLEERLYHQARDLSRIRDSASQSLPASYSDN